MDNALTLDEALEDLVSIEDFLDYFEIRYDPAVVRVNRLHILQRFRDYLDRQSTRLPGDEAGRHAFHRHWLERAYQDFVHSDALREKVFAVFRRLEQSGCGTCGGCLSPQAAALS